VFHETWIVVCGFDGRWWNLGIHCK
jgi:hypothetical protein